MLRAALAGSPHELDQALVRIDDDFTALAQVCGLSDELSPDGRVTESNGVLQK